MSGGGPFGPSVHWSRVRIVSLRVSWVRTYDRFESADGDGDRHGTDVQRE